MNSNRYIVNFTKATTMLGPWEYEDPKADRIELDDFALRSSPLWWRPETVEGMDPASFKTLTASQRQQLEQLRQKFLNTFQGTEVHRELVLSARDALIGIYRLIGKQVTSLECMTVAQVLSEVIHDEKFQGRYVAFSMAFENDWAGDPSINVMVFVDGAESKDRTFFKNVAQDIDQIYRDLRMRGVSQRIYLNIRTIQEQVVRIQREAA